MKVHFSILWVFLVQVGAFSCVSILKTPKKGDLASYEKRSLNYKLIEELLFFDDYSIQDQLTCFTCEESGSNEECNKNAIDEPCFIREKTLNLTKEAQQKRACMTVHKFNYLTLKTVSIEKKCTLNCAQETVGCVTLSAGNGTNTDDHIRVILIKLRKCLYINQINNLIFHLQVCSYCCNKDYCNLDSITNQREAIQLANEFLFEANSSSSLGNLDNIFSFVLIFCVLLRLI
jgi:hypothetical protein